ncbi:hypothetical protein Tco_0951556 [Tanacetum coccineum]|uniref:Zinc finger, CCHC-type n=1 Tax=Tanacetum coccineum TaxID=301880 RepID=A0ABQ5DXA1_9ASTR
MGCERIASLYFGHVGVGIDGGDVFGVAEVPSASALQVLRRLGSIFTSVYVAVQKLKKDSWLELQFSLADNSKLNVRISSKEITPQLSFNHLAISQASLAQDGLGGAECTTVKVSLILLGQRCGGQGAAPLARSRGKGSIDTVKDMTAKFGKLDKFEGNNFRRWQKKMHFLLTTLKVVYVLSTHMPEFVEDEPLD